MPEATETVEDVTTETVEDETGKDGKPFDPARAQATIDKLRLEIKALKPAATEAETLRQEKAAIEQQQRVAEEERLKKQGEFETLAATRETERDAVKAELETAKADLARANEILGADLDKRIEKWPPQIKKLVPSGEGVTALARLEAIQNLQEAADSLMSAAPRGGNGAGPVASGGAIDAKADAAAREAHRRSVGY